MNDRFKFRAWDKYINKMGFVIGLNFEEGKIKFGSPFKEDRMNWGTLDGYILMQSTGLKDKNGKLIFEGDIVKYYDAQRNELTGKDLFQVQSVFWKKNIGWFPMFEQEEVGGQSFLNDGYAFEVIGNIYENPELLTK